ncbi:MAG: hypothetical protein EB059_00270 [Alphaproteobacteria bacterium]|nr:hypothetical protein [Alphaproteobacteria bacterium]
MSISKILPYSLCALVGALVVIGALNLVGVAMAAPQTGRSLGPYMLMQHSNPTAAAGVFRVNVNTGYVSYCFIDQGARPAVSCTAETP